MFFQAAALAPVAGEARVLPGTGSARWPAVAFLSDLLPAAGTQIGLPSPWGPCLLGAHCL
jgi:hypothetical protein